MHHAVGDKVGSADAEHLKAPEPHRAGGRTVAVVVGNNGDVFALVACDGKPFSSFPRAFEHGGRNHPLPLLLKVRGFTDASGGKRTGNGRKEPGTCEPFGCMGIVGAGKNARHAASSPLVSKDLGSESKSQSSGETTFLRFRNPSAPRFSGTSVAEVP